MVRAQTFVVCCILSHKKGHNLYLNWILISRIQQLVKYKLTFRTFTEIKRLINEKVNVEMSLE